MRGFEIAMASLALRASPTRPQKHERRLIPAIDDADAAMLDRAAISHQRAALIASLWPAPTRQCVAWPSFEELAAPAIFGAVFRVSWPFAPEADARSLQTRLGQHFPASEPPPPAIGQRAA